MESDGKEILKHFDNIFGTDALKKIDFSDKKMKLLKTLFEYFEEDLYTPSPKYEKLRRKHIEIGEELEKTFTKEQQALFEKYWEVGNELAFEEEQQLFLFGFIVARNFDIDSKIN